jgi:hypothetical protein
VMERWLHRVFQQAPRDSSSCGVFLAMKQYFSVCSLPSGFMLAAKRFQRSLATLALEVRSCGTEITI